MVKIDGIKVYRDFKTRGYTTAGTFTHFDDLIKDGIGVIIITKEDKLRIEQILNNAEKKKHRQTKFGDGLIFCEIIFNHDSQIYHRVIITGIGTVYNMFGNVKEKRAFITDLTSMVDYKVTNSSDLEQLQNFNERIKNQ